MRRAQEITLVYAVMACLFVILFLQFFLLTVAAGGFVEGRGDVLWPATLASGLLAAASLGLLRAVSKR